jgi:molybdopterin-biosynthesis enzyme MoeA-like protein
MVSVGDNRQRIADAIQAGLSRADIVMTCGGLGPTVDDMTRQGVADATERGLTFHQTLLDQIAERFRGFRVKMTENNRQQAYLPDDAIVIENPVGTAPAFAVEHNGGVVISLPGVPREMKYLIKERVIPYLRERHQLGIIKARILKTAGIGESALDDMIGRALLEQSNPTVGLNAHMGQIDVRITAKAPSEDDADVMIAQSEALVRERAGRFIFGADQDTLEEVFVALCRSLDVHVVVVEAGITDVVSQVIQSTDGGKEVLKAVHQAPLPEDLFKQFDVDLTLPLRQLVQSVAERACIASGADVAIVVISQPDVEEGADNDEATIIAVHTRGGYRDRVYGFGAQSDFARAWGKSWLLSTAWRMLKEQTDAG